MVIWNRPREARAVKVDQVRPWQTKAEPGTARYSRVQPRTVLKRQINVLYFRKAGALRISNMILRGRWTQVDKSGCRWMHVNESGWKYLRCYKHIWCSYLDLVHRQVRSRWWILPCQPSSCFLAVQNSSIGDLVTDSVTESGLYYLTFKERP